MYGESFDAPVAKPHGGTSLPNYEENAQKFSHMRENLSLYVALHLISKKKIPLFYSVQYVILFT